MLYNTSKPQLVLPSAKKLMSPQISATSTPAEQTLDETTPPVTSIRVPEVKLKLASLSPGQRSGHGKHSVSPEVDMVKGDHLHKSKKQRRDRDEHKKKHKRK